MAGAVEMCSGLGVCRKTLDGTMCPVVHGDARRSALDARPRERAAARHGRPARRIGAWRRGRARGDAISASSAARARPSARSASTSRGSRANSSPTTGSGTARRSRARVLGHVHDAVALGQPVRAALEHDCAQRAGPVAERAAARPRSPADAAGVGVDDVREAVHSAAALRVASTSRGNASAPRRRMRSSSTTRSRTTTIPTSGWPALHVLEAPGCDVGARAQRLLRPAADFAGAARRGPAPGRAEHRSRCIRSPSAAPLVFFEPSCLSAVREDVPVAAPRRGAAPGAARGRARGALRGVRRAGVAGRARAAFAQARTDADSAPRPLSSEGDGARSRRRRRCSRAFPARRSSISTPAAAAWPDRSATCAITSTCRGPSASAGCCRPRAVARPDSVARRERRLVPPSGRRLHRRRARCIRPSSFVLSSRRLA